MRYKKYMKKKLNPLIKNKFQSNVLLSLIRCLLMFVHDTCHGNKSQPKQQWQIRGWTQDRPTHSTFPRLDVVWMIYFETYSRPFFNLPTPLTNGSVDCRDDGVVDFHSCSGCSLATAATQKYFPQLQYFVLPLRFHIRGEDVFTVVTSWDGRTACVAGLGCAD